MTPCLSISSSPAPKGQIGFIQAKRIVSALPELGDGPLRTGPLRTRCKVTVDGWEREEEEEERKEPPGSCFGSSCRGSGSFPRTTAPLAVVSLRFRILTLYQEQLESEGCSKHSIAQQRAAPSRQLNELETYNDLTRKGLAVLVEHLKGRFCQVILKELPEQSCSERLKEPARGSRDRF